MADGTHFLIKCTKGQPLECLLLRHGGGGDGGRDGAGADLRAGWLGRPREGRGLHRDAPTSEQKLTRSSVPRGDGDYQLVEWDGTSCGVWEVQREVDDRANSPEGEGGGLDGEEEDCRRGHVRPHIATTRHLGVVRPTSWPPPERTASENSTSPTFGEYPRAQRYAPGDRERSCKRCRPR